MATGTAPSKKPGTESDGQSSQFIDQRIDKTRNQLRLHDVVYGLLLILIGALAFLIVMALIDHWVIALGHAGRAIAFLILIAGVSFVLWRSVISIALKLALNNA